MALFSQRFWLRLSTLDARVVATQRAYQDANTRLLIGRRLVLGAALGEYWQEVKLATGDARSALVELNYFCAGRSRNDVVLTTRPGEGIELPTSPADTAVPRDGLAAALPALSG